MARRSNGGSGSRGKTRVSRASLPTVTAAKVLEAKSRAILKEVVSPWLVTNWTEHDYGIDAIVEVTRARSVGDNFDATGKRFAVQLKATEEDYSGRETVSVRVRPEQIRYWIESTEPVLLVLCHVPTRVLCWRWIDHVVVDELTQRDPSWVGQETVSVVLSTSRVLNAPAMKEIAQFVSAFRHTSRRLLAPGTYVDLLSRLSAVAAKMSSHARSVGFESVTARLTGLEASVRSSTYIVALTGPARAGKSTLLNALVGRDVSPVGRLPTTAVSLLVTAGARDEVEVLLADDGRVRGPATSTFLEEYATQERNPDNRKGVRMVTVKLVNEMLERGVAYADAPGLHDPSADIRAVTETALKTAHAILYVVDVSPAKNGGFSISQHHVDDLNRLRSMAERLFVVLNKDDVLGPAERQEVFEYAEATLRKYGIWDSLPTPPLFLSAQAAWTWHREGRRGRSPVATLEDAIWTHLLRTNSTGLDRLASSVSELRRASSDFVSLLAARRLDGTEAFRLRGSLEACRAREKELRAACQHRVENDEQFIRQKLFDDSAALLADLKNRLAAVPVDHDLPPTSRIDRELQEQVLKLLSDAWREASARFQSFAAHVSREVEQSLQQVRLATSPPDKVQFLLPQVPALAVAPDSFEEAWTGLFTGGLFAVLVGGPWAWTIAGGGWLVGLVLGRERRRKRQIARIAERATESLTTALETVFAQVREKIHIYLESLEQHVTDRISVFVHDVELQLQKLGSAIPPEEQRRMESCEAAVRAGLTTLTAVCSEIGIGGTDVDVGRS